jgi:lipopolysaccharide/colanic/teichoic acid biosynthesis glycosyltransferase
MEEPLEGRVMYLPYAVRYVPRAVILAVRLTDIFIALLGIMLLGILVPLLWFFITRDKGPFFFTQWRVGKNGKIFKLWKIRTMRLSAIVDDLQVSGPHDLRRTRIGVILRRFRIDEFPQFINVLLGDMSVVGPRPETPGRSEHLREHIAGYDRRVEGVLPGITGWAQIYGDYCSSVSDEQTKHIFDLIWIERKRFSFCWYLYVIIYTPWAMIFKKGF